MSKIEKIRAEIERRYAYQKEMYSKTKPDGRPNDGWAESLAIMGELEELRDFIDTLSEEPDKSLDEAAEEYQSDARRHVLDNTPIGTAKDAFIAGAEWQKAQKAQKAIEDYLLEQLSEVCRNLPNLPPGWRYELHLGDTTYNPETNAFDINVVAVLVPPPSPFYIQNKQLTK